MPDYTIMTGDCLSSIARRFGFADYRTIYDHPRNAELRASRPNPNILFPGDILFVPEKEPRVETRPTDARHVFRTRVPSTRLRLRLTDRHDQPRAGVEYKLSVGPIIVQKRTGPDGLIDEISISIHAFFAGGGRDEGRCPGCCPSCGATTAGTPSKTSSPRSRRATGSASHRRNRPGASAAESRG